MENLKFRAWHKGLKKYFDIVEIDFMNERIVYIFNDYSVPEQTKEVFDFNEVIIEQYTGMKDMDGQEIYVGDIVSYRDLQGWEMEIGHCKYNEKYGVFMFYHNEENDDDREFNFFIAGYFLNRAKVVGNIHENKELLK